MMVVLKSQLHSPPLQGTSKLKLIFSGNFKIAASDVRLAICCYRNRHKKNCLQKWLLELLQWPFVSFISVTWNYLYIPIRSMATILGVISTITNRQYRPNLLQFSLSQYLKLLSLSATLFLRGSCFTKYVNDNKGLTTNHHFES